MVVGFSNLLIFPDDWSNRYIAILTQIATNTNRIPIKWHGGDLSFKVFNEVAWLKNLPPHRLCQTTSSTIFYRKKLWHNYPQKLNVMDHIKLSVSLSACILFVFKIIIKLDYLKILLTRSWSTKWLSSVTISVWSNQMS